jgi:hypothetical protein
MFGQRRGHCRSAWRGGCAIDSCSGQLEEERFIHAMASVATSNLPPAHEHRDRRNQTGKDTGRIRRS